MRLIDADELERRFKNHKRFYCKNRIEFLALSDKEKARVDELDNCIAEILNAPTIEPERKKGYKINQHSYPAKWLCSECGARHFDFSEKFCSECGAKMEEPEDIPMEYFESGGR